MITFPSSITGAAVAGLTSPTYTLVVDSAPPSGVTKSAYVSAVGGTQTGVNVHSIASPFTMSWRNPLVLSSPGVTDATGVYRNPTRRNKYELLTRKGGLPIAGQAPRLNMIKTTFEVEAGVETTDPSQVLAMLSAHIGGLTALANGIKDTLLTGAA